MDQSQLGNMLAEIEGLSDAEVQALLAEYEEEPAEERGAADSAAQSLRRAIFSSEASDRLRENPRATSKPAMFTIVEKMFCGIDVAKICDAFE